MKLLVKPPPLPILGCLQIQTGFAAPHEVQMSATGEQFVTLVQVWTEEGDEVRFDRDHRVWMSARGGTRLHRSIVPAARPETHPLLPWRWMSRLWCQAIHKFFHLGDRKIYFVIVLFFLFWFFLNPHSVYLRHFNTIDVNRWAASEGRKWPISTCVFVRFKLIQRRWVNKHLTAH